MKTAVVILNWNTKDYLKQFVPALLHSLEGQDAKLVVADNSSTDGSVEMLKAEFPAVETIAFDKNYGFTGGYNRALAALDTEYAVLINSDIEVTDNWLRPLVEHMDSHSECGACGPKLLALDRACDGSFRRTSRFEYAGAAGGFLDRFCYPFCRGRVLKKVCQDEGQYDTKIQVHWASGACLLVRMSVWRLLGGLDERFFAHMEEIDWCWRARLAGYTVWNIPQSVVFHIGGGTLAPDSPFKLKLNYRNSLLMMRKNLPAAVGKFRAFLRIETRFALDWAAIAVYVLGGHWSYAKAVKQAHNEQRKEKIVSSSPSKSGGICDICILALSATKGRKIFKSLNKVYESCN